MREKRGAGELAAQARSPEAWGPPPPSAAPRKPRPSPALSSPHQVALTHGLSPAFLFVALPPHGSQWPL